MQLPVFVLAFLIFWLSVVGLGGLGILTGGIVKFRQTLSDPFRPELLITSGMFFFGYALCLFSFKSEAAKSKAFLAELFAARQI